MGAGWFLTWSTGPGGGSGEGWQLAARVVILRGGLGDSSRVKGKAPDLQGPRLGW
jgi:hypothetical protein